MSELEDWKQAASVEAGLRREFLARALRAEHERKSLAEALEIIANGGNAVHFRWMTTGPKTREQMAEIAKSALLAVSEPSGNRKSET